MRHSSQPLQLFALAVAVAFAIALMAQQQEQPANQTNAHTEKIAATASDVSAVLWKDPGEISSLDLLNGIGGKDHTPNGEQFKFVKEDLNGTSTKFYVEDPDGVQWLVKLGEEAKPEVAATRLVWAMGYFTDEDYYLPAIHVAGIPHLQRGSKDVSSDGTVNDARLKRQNKAQKHIADWKWSDNPFVKTRELEGLKVMMALINNWDLKTVNNKVYAEGSAERRFVVSDLGAAFGKTGGVSSRSKGNPKDYREAGFVEHTDRDHVDFVMNTRPLPLLAPFEPRNFITRNDMEGIVKHIPIADARWMAQQLSRLTPTQIGDAFRAAGFSPAEVEEYTLAVRARIAQLNTL